MKLDIIPDEDVINRHFIYWLKRKERSDRERLLGSILEISKQLVYINDIFDERRNIRKDTIKFLHILGLINIGRGKKRLVKFIDKFKIADYFPGYVRNKDRWEHLRKYGTIPDILKELNKD